MRRWSGSVWRKRGILLLGIVLVVAAVLGWRTAIREEQVFPVVEASAIPLGTKAGGPEAQKTPPSYGAWLRSEQAQALPEAQDIAPIVIRAASYSAASAEAGVAVRNDGPGGDAVDWTEPRGWLEWTVDVPKDGLYTLAFEYMPLKGSFANVVRGVQIDGRYPYREAERVTLARWWKDGKHPYDRNALGNEIRPVQEELGGWRTATAADYAASSEPLLWPLGKGRHTIRLTGGREPVALASLTLAPPEKIPAYAEYAADAGAGDAGASEASSAGSDWFAVIETEQYAGKSAIGIQTQSVAEPFASPDPEGRIVYNAIGGDRWMQAGDAIEWEFTVPETGWYAIDLNYFQGYNGKAKAYRTIMLDGRVPFREMLRYALPANTELTLRPLADAAGKPYLFHLEGGTHRLRMIADRSPLAPAVEALQDAMTELSAIERDIRVISGNYGSGSSANLDTGRTWDVKAYDPGIEAKLADVLERLRTARDYIDGLNQQVTDPTTAISSAMNSLQQMLDDVNDIPNRVETFADIQTIINTWIRPMESQGVLLDSIVVRTPRADSGRMAPNLWDKIRYSAVNFARTFFQSYDSKDLNDAEALTVWVQRGRDYVDLLQQMIEADFTPKTGIRVNVNLMPSTNVLMLGNAAGDQPDVALGLGMETPVDYAMRGAAADLSAMPGFAEVAKRFHPGVMRSYTYNGGTYALPETQSFMVMFYRTDVLERLGLTPPDTWDDLLDLLPTLQENGMTVYYPAKEFVLPFYQQGAEFYTADGMETTIDSKAGQAAFQRWTDWFVKSDMPKEVPAFFNHFRFGDIPIGIADFNTYIQLTVAAPEIMGKWKMAPLPGLRGADGQVVRWSAQQTSAAMVMAKSKRQEEAWAFLDWWTSAPVQAQFASDIESFAGIEYRWNPANIEALRYVPWPSEDMEVLAEQGRWGKNMPYVPGYYFLGREMDFAWNNTVLKGMPPKEALGKAASSLQREMARKQKEFGFGPGTDLHVPLDQREGGDQP